MYNLATTQDGIKVFITEVTQLSIKWEDAERYTIEQVYTFIDSEGYKVYCLVYEDRKEVYFEECSFWDLKQAIEEQGHEIE